MCTIVLKLSIIISSDSSERQAIYSFERLPIDIYNLRNEYQSSAPYRTITKAEDEEENDKIVLFGIEQYSIFYYY